MRSVDLRDEVVDLALRRLHDHFGIDQAGRPHDLLDDLRGDLPLVLAGRGREEHDLVHALGELLEPQRPVVHRRRQPEAVLDQRVLARTVALELPVQLRDRDVRLVDDAQPVVGEVVEQRVRRLVADATVEVHRVVLDARAAPDLAQHLEVVGGAHAQPLRLEQLALALELGEPLGELGLDAGDRLLQPLLVGGVVRRGEQRERVELLDDLAGERVDRAHALDLVAEELDAHRPLLVGREHLDRVAAHPELVAGEREVVALVLQLDEPAQDRALLALLALARASGAACEYISGEPRP